MKPKTKTKKQEQQQKQKQYKNKIVNKFITIIRERYLMPLLSEYNFKKDNNSCFIISIE